MINELPTIFEVVTGTAKKQVKEKATVNHGSNKSKSNTKVVKCTSLILIFSVLQKDQILDSGNCVAVPFLKNGSYYNRLFHLMVCSYNLRVATIYLLWLAVAMLDGICTCPSGFTTKYQHCNICLYMWHKDSHYLVAHYNFVFFWLKSSEDQNLKENNQKYSNRRMKMRAWMKMRKMSTEKPCAGHVVKIMRLMNSGFAVTSVRSGSMASA